MDSQTWSFNPLSLIDINRKISPYMLCFVSLNAFSTFHLPSKKNTNFAPSFLSIMYGIKS